MLLNELTDGAEIDQVLLVRESERRQRRDGGDYLRLQLGDRTGAVACMVWEELATEGNPSAIARALLAKFADVSLEQLETDVRAFLDELAEAGLVVPVDAE